jgi:hypothetical protein
MKVIFKRKEYEGHCEKCQYFIKKLDNPEKYPKTILVICSLNRKTIEKCPLMTFEFSFLQ